MTPPIAPIDRFDVYLVYLDPAIGSEIQKTRPALVISPNEMNHRIATVIIAPMTTEAAQSIATSIADLATFLGAKSIEYGERVPSEWRPTLLKHA